MQTKRDYDIVRKGIHFDLKKMCPVDQKGSDTVYFPSRGEYSCFRKLCNIFSTLEYEIIIHPRLKTSVCDWVLDFKVVAKNDQSRRQLAKLCNFFNDSAYSQISCVYVEYKGFADSNFRHKFGKLFRYCPSISSLIILVGSEQSRYMDKKNGCNRSVWRLDSFEDHCVMLLTAKQIEDQ